MHNMDKKTVQKKINHLQCLNSFKPKDRIAVVDICSDDCILAVCEACYNFLKDIIPLTYYQKCRLKSKLMPICFHVRKLADYKVSVKEKRGHIYLDIKVPVHFILTSIAVLEDHAYKVHRVYLS